MATSQALKLIPQSAGFRTNWDSTGSSLAGILSTEGLQWVSSRWDLQILPTSRNEDQRLIWSHMGPPMEEGNMNLGMGSPHQPPIMALVAPYTETPTRERVLSRPAEFLAIRETEGRHDCYSQRAS